MSRSLRPTFVILIGLLLPVFSCGIGPEDVPPTRRTGQISVETIPPERVIQGKPVRYTIHIKNHTKKPVLLLELKPQTQPFPVRRDTDPEHDRIQKGAEYHWTHRLSGRLDHQPERKRFVLYPTSSRITYVPEKLLYSGLLLPDQKTTVKLRAVYQDQGPLDQNFVLRYVHPTRRQLKNRAYLPKQIISTDLNQSVMFRRIPSPVSLSSLADRPYLLFHPDFDIIRERSFSRSIRVYQRSFSRDRAVQRLKQRINNQNKIENIHFAPWKDAWIIQTGPEQLWSVTATRATRLQNLTMTHIQYLSGESGPVRFYINKDWQSNQNVISNIDKLIKPKVDLRSSSHWSSPRKEAARQIARLRSAQFGLRWIREPITNRNVLYVYREP